MHHTAFHSFFFFDVIIKIEIFHSILLMGDNKV